MRVISGSARGLRLEAPEGLNTRPTTDRIKESLFNIINYDLQGINFLDLFSGSGGIGIEALSRGAKFAVFVDGAVESIKIIEKNLSFTRLGDKAEVIRADVINALTSLSKRNLCFDIIFMDPPYNNDLYNNTLKVIFDNKLLTKEGFIIAEQSLEDELPVCEGLEVFRVKEYKTTKMTFIGYSEVV